MRVSTSIGAIIIFAVVSVAGIFIWTVDQYRDQAVKQKAANEKILEYQLEGDYRSLSGVIEQPDKFENSD